MKDLFENNYTKEISKRINNLQNETIPKWGRFNASLMICHLQDNLRYVLGISQETKVLIKGPPMFIRSLVRLYFPWPKNSPTGSNMLETKPVGLDEDKLKFIELIEQFRLYKVQKNLPMHPFFGKLDNLGWGRLLYRHIDYHLKQFNV